MTEENTHYVYSEAAIEFVTVAVQLSPPAPNLSQHQGLFK